MEDTNTYEIRKGIDGDILVKITLDGVESFVPMDESNADYQAYLASQKEEK